MSDRTKNILSGFLALALSVLLVPGAADAQEQEQETPQQGECTVRVTPQPVQTGEAAVSVTARLSRSVGAVEGFEAPDESGLELADPKDIQKRSMAREEGEGEPQPIQMARGEQSQVTLWLNTQNAESGSYEVTLEGANGDCKGNVSVGEQGDERPGTGR
jgi:hypothetical protein